MRKLLLDVARCSVASGRLDAGQTSPCDEIVDSQAVQRALDFRVPEPWSGDIANAPILFISSNPSIAHDERYPTGDWTDDEIFDFFTRRFNAGYIQDGIRYLKVNGTYSDARGFWPAVKARARELLQRAPVPGHDYALTEVVHCKSVGEIGVPGAIVRCATQFLDRVLGLMGARLILVLGNPARDAVAPHFGIGVAQAAAQRVHGPLLFRGAKRCVVFSPHTNARAPRQLPVILSPVELALVRQCAQHGCP